MKKLFLSMALAFVCLTAGAQLYVGGELSYWREWQKGANKTNFWVAPEVGYNLNEKFALGIYLDYEYEYKNPRTVVASKEITNTYWIAPYVRYNIVKFGVVNLFVDGVVSWATYKTKTNGVCGNAHNAWAVGLEPGVSVNLTERLSFITLFGFLGYMSADDLNRVYKRSGLGGYVNANNLKFGLVYNL